MKNLIIATTIIGSLAIGFCVGIIYISRKYSCREYKEITIIPEVVIKDTDTFPFNKLDERDIAKASKKLNPRYTKLSNLIQDDGEGYYRLTIEKSFDGIHYIQIGNKLTVVANTVYLRSLFDMEKGN